MASASLLRALRGLEQVFFALFGDRQVWPYRDLHICMANVHAPCLELSHGFATVIRHLDQGRAEGVGRALRELRHSKGIADNLFERGGCGEWLTRHLHLLKPVFLSLNFGRLSRDAQSVTLNLASGGRLKKLKVCPPLHLLLVVPRRQF